MAQAISEMTRASRERERAWAAISDPERKPTLPQIDTLFAAHWQVAIAEAKGIRTDTHREPNPQYDEVTKVDLLRWAQKPETVIGFAARQTWLEATLEHYQGQVDSHNGQYTWHSRKDPTPKEVTRLEKATVRSNALQKAINLLDLEAKRRRDNRQPLLMDELSASFAQLLDPSARRSESENEDITDQEEMRAGLERLRKTFGAGFLRGLF